MRKACRGGERSRTETGEEAPGRNRAALAAAQGGEWEAREPAGSFCGDAGERGGGLGPGEAEEKPPCLEGGTNKMSLAWREPRGQEGSPGQAPRLWPKQQEERGGRRLEGQVGGGQGLVFWTTGSRQWIHKSEVQDRD